MNYFNSLDKFIFLIEVKRSSFYVLCGDNGHKRPIGKEYPIMKKLGKINGFQKNNGIYYKKGMGYKFEI